MKLFKLILCMLLLCLCLAACGQGGDNGDGTTLADDASDVTTTEAITTAPEPAVMIDIVADGKSDYVVARSEDVNGSEQQLFVKFYQELCKRTGVDFKYTELLNRAEIDTSAKEILLGNTNRAESVELLDKLNAAGGNRFGILLKGNKLAIAGTSTYQTYLGLDYLMTNFLTGDEGSASLAIEEDFEYISESSENSGFDIDSLIESGKGIAFVMKEALFKVPSAGGYAVMQGGCTDGRYAYIGMLNKTKSPELAKIYKYDLETMKVVKVSDALDTSHTNDIAYDSKNHRLAISRCTGDENWCGISFVDPDTLELIENIRITVGHRAIEYLPSTNEYLLAANWSITRTDENFNVISSFNCSDPQYTSQGCYSDEKYVYDVRYVSGSNSLHYIVIHKLDGTYIGTVPVYGLANLEPEHMFRYNGRYMMGCYKSNTVYEMELVPENWW
ncbi:MAG: hypothetical protein IJY27_00375 [Clostridia bacterium]|nr:hypothetical protein [Clostridia bacterium]